jgi:long-chain acyl-CoA synthetase
MNLAQMIERNVRRIPDWPAVLSEIKTYTWKEFDQLINKMGNALRKLGVSKGDRVAVCLPNSPEYLVTYFAIVKLGAIVVPFNILFKSTEITYIVNNAEAKVFVTLAGRTIDDIIEMREEIPSIEKIILVGGHEMVNVLSYSKYFGGRIR